MRCRYSRAFDVYAIHKRAHGARLPTSRPGMRRESCRAPAWPAWWRFLWPPPVGVTHKFFFWNLRGCPRPLLPMIEGEPRPPVRCVYHRRRVIFKPYRRGIAAPVLVIIDYRARLQLWRAISRARKSERRQRFAFWEPVRILCPPAPHKNKVLRLAGQA